MNLDALSRLIRRPRFLARGVGAVLHAVPELVDGAPPLTLAGDGVVIPSSVGPALADRVAKAVADAVQDALSGQSRPLDRRDPVVAALVTLVSEGLVLSPGAGVVPLLQLVREAGWVVTHPTDALEAQLTTLRALPTGRQVEAWGRVASAMQGRIGLCCAEVAGSGLTVPALAQAILSTRLALVFPLGAVDVSEHMAILLGLTGNPLPAPAGHAAVVAIRLVVGGVSDRKSARTSTPDDDSLLLGPLRPEILSLGLEAAVRRMVGDPASSALILGALPRFVDAAALVRAGVPEPNARALLSAEGRAAASAGLGALAVELGRWEVVAALAQTLHPLDVRGRTDRALLVPHRPLKLAVVGVGLGRLRSAGAARGASPPVVERAWRELVRAAVGVASVDLGGAGILLFEDVGMAVRVALRIADRFASTGKRPAVSVAWGTVLGGTDGEVTRVSGPAVDAALRWLAHPGDGLPTGRRLGVQNGWLVGDGVAIDESAAALVASSWKGPPTTVPKAIPAELGLVSVFEAAEETLAFARIGSMPGGFELLAYPHPEWDALVRPFVRGPARVAVDGGALDSASPPDDSEIDDDDLDDDDAGSHGDDELDDELDADLDVALEAALAGVRDPKNGPVEPEAALDGPVLVSGVPLAAPPTGDPFLARAPAEEDDPLADFLRDLKRPPEEDAESGPGHDGPVVLALGGPSSSSSSPLPPVVAAEPLGVGSVETLPDLLDDADEADDAPEPAVEDEADTAFSGFYLPGVTSTAHSPGSASAVARAGPIRASTGGVTVEDESTDETPSRAAAASFRDLAPPAAFPDPQPSRARTIDFGFVLDGYVVYTDADKVVFGRPYGRRVVDAHAYETGGGLGRAYQRFLGDKIAEGFVPRTDLVADLPARAAPTPLDPELLARAWQALS